jgi:hypothetical protein
MAHVEVTASGDNIILRQGESQLRLPNDAVAQLIQDLQRLADPTGAGSGEGRPEGEKAREDSFGSL